MHYKTLSFFTNILQINLYSFYQILLVEQIDKEEADLEHNFNRKYYFLIKDLHFLVLK